MAASGSVPASGPRTAAQLAAEINDELALLYGRAPVLLGSVSGTDVIIGSATPAASFTAYAAGQTFSFVAAANNTGSVTLNINSIGAKNLRTAAGAALVAGQLVEDTLYVVHVVPIAGPDVEFRLIGSGGGSASTGTPSVDVVFTGASATFAKADYPGAKEFVVWAIGVGGGGGNASTDSGGGGGAGGVARKRFIPADLAASITVTVNGTASTFAHTTAVVGNAGSAGSSPSGGAGGTATGGDFNITGAAGTAGADVAGDTGTGGSGGVGGSTWKGWGIGGGGGRGSISPTAAQNGSAGVGYGGGGGGGGSRSSSPSDGDGGAGAPGAVIVEVIY